MKITNFTVGSDPELFLINTKTNKVVSAIGIIPGEKGDAWRGDDMPEGYGIEIDNILAEYNIPPCTTKKEFIHHMNYMKDYIRNFIQKINPDLDILCAASKHVDEDQLNNPIAKLFGCSVDFNVYTGDKNPKPQGETTDLRSAGLHIHLGYDNHNLDDSLKLIRYFDMYLGIPSVLYDQDKERCILYGKAGSFRFTRYGFEYRPLSSAMNADDERLSAIWDGIVRAIDAFNNNVPFMPADLVQHIVNTRDLDAARVTIKEYKLID